jgi:hypothetical protein
MSMSMSPRISRTRSLRCLPLCLALAVAAAWGPSAWAESSPAAGAVEARFEGAHYRGRGDVEYLRLLDTARRMFEPDPELQNLSMLYEPRWNGLVEGPTWDAWWIQNSYGTTYSILPFLHEPFITFLQRSQDLWFDQMGDGRRVGASPPFDWVAPDGCLCDAARPGWVVYKQGDGRIGIHDWGMEFTAAGIVLQAELLLISREPEAIAHYLPKLERSANFIESRRDPTNDLFLAGPAGNLLAPSYAGWRRPDGTYDKAYLAGLSVTCIAALDRLIELEKLAGRTRQAAVYAERRELARRGLARLTADEGYLIRSLDPDGVRHGVYGAEKHGYFEASPNHDAIAFRVVDDEQAERIFRKIESLPGLRPHHFILPNYPSYDDMYERPEGLWAYGTWVNGGHWSTCEARMMLAYYRLGKFDDARSSMKQLLTFATNFRMDNPLTKCGSEVYQPKEAINLCYDSFGPPAALMRGLFEYLYTAEGLTLIPHIPAAIIELEQRDPVRFGSKRVLLSTVGAGPISSVRVNGLPWRHFTPTTVFLPYGATPAVAKIEIGLGSAGSGIGAAKLDASSRGSPPAKAERAPTDLLELRKRAARLKNFEVRLVREGMGSTCEAAHARLAVKCVETAALRRRMIERAQLKPLDGQREKAADLAYVRTARNLCDGIEVRLMDAAKAGDPQHDRIREIWATTAR